MNEKIMNPSDVQIWSSPAVIDIQRINPTLLHWVRSVDFKEALKAQAKLYEDIIADYESAHLVLDKDPSKIIRNAKDGYPDGREERVLTLTERVKAICKYGSDYARWFNKLETKIKLYEGQIEILEDELFDLASELENRTGAKYRAVKSAREALANLAEFRKQGEMR